MLFIALILILILSVAGALFSLKKELSRSEHLKAQEVQKSLEKGRVIFYAPQKSDNHDSLT